MPQLRGEPAQRRLTARCTALNPPANSGSPNVNPRVTPVEPAAAIIIGYRRDDVRTRTLHG